MKPGTQTDTKVRLKGKGVPSLRSREVRGDHYVTLVVQVPDKLSSEAKDLLKQFDQASDNSLTAVQDAEKPEDDGRDSGKKKKFWNK